MLVYDVTTHSLWYYKNTIWTDLGDLSKWSLTGNAGTDPAIHFIGTTDNAALKLKVNNFQSGIIDPILFNTSIGYQSLSSITTGYNNTAIGSNVLSSNNTGYQNVAIGRYALVTNNSGHDNIGIGHAASISGTTCNANIAIGSYALRLNSTGNGNIGIGTSALYSNLGNENMAVGNSSLVSNTTGEKNTALGSQSLLSNQAGNSNVAIGYQAGYYETTSNNLYIDNQSRASLKDGRNKALIYGVFDADPANQRLVVNGKVGIRIFKSRTINWTLAMRSLVTPLEIPFRGLDYLVFQTILTN